MYTKLVVSLYKHTLNSTFQLTVVLYWGYLQTSQRNDVAYLLYILTLFLIVTRSTYFESHTLLCPHWDGTILFTRRRHNSEQIQIIRKVNTTRALEILLLLGLRSVGFRMPVIAFCLLVDTLFDPS